MRTTRQTSRAIAAALLSVIGLASIEPVSAQTYPSRPITMVIPFPAGGPTDTVGRIVAERMRASLGQPIIVENVVGASGSIAVGKAARAAGDGYTLSFGNWSTHVANGAVFALQYDLLNDFEPISLVVDSPMLLVANNAIPAKNLRELVAWLKANPNKASVGTPGMGGASHLAGVFFQKVTETHFAFVPYRGVAPAMQDMIAGRIDMMFDLAANSLPHVHVGSIRAFAALAKNRLSGAAHIPTVDEAGLPGLYVSSWQAIWAPKGTPKLVIEKLNAAVVDALADPAVRQRLVDMAQEIPLREQQTPEALGKLQKSEIDKWWPIIKAANIKAE